jgi:hypothetical protein
MFMKKYINKISIIFLIIFAFVACQKEDDSEMPAMAKSNSDHIIRANSSIFILNESETHAVNLLAGQYKNTGSVSVEVSEGNFLVTYKTDYGFTLSELHLWIGTDLSDMPQTNKGNPKVGRFPYKAEGLGGLNTYQFVIPIDDLFMSEKYCDKVLNFAAHANILSDNGVESAWANGNRIADKSNWATYFSMMYYCNEDDDDDDDDDDDGDDDGEDDDGEDDDDADDDSDDDSDYETAFAHGDYTFIDLGLTDSRWGWVIEIDQYGTFYAPIYAGADQNSINSGTEVGKLKIYYDGFKLKVTYKVNTGYSMEETHLFASNVPPTDDTPEQYGNVHDLQEEESDVYLLELSGTPIYLIAHAVVCSTPN